MNKIFIALFISLTVFSCSMEKDANILITDLTEGWSFTKSGEEKWYPAIVPGTVHTDLMTNSLIPDPYIGWNEDSIQWIENEDWIYKCNFRVDGSLLNYKNIKLVFKGLDTYADVYLNDSLIIKADNMFISWEQECGQNLRPGDNELKIHFYSAVEKGMEKLKQLDYTLFATNEQAPEGAKTNVFTRKAPFHFGWDWGPRLVTCGIWRPVHLKAWNEAIISDVHLKQVAFNPQEVNYNAEINIESAIEGKYEVEIFADGESKTKELHNLKQGINQLSVPLNFENPELWWTNGLGNQKLYNIEVRLSEGKVLDNHSVSLGIRKIELVQEPDSSGRSFYFKLNEVPIFMKGANYIPGDIFIPKVTTERYAQLIDDAVEANMNMLRVWGGAIYENDVFYDLCDEKGILVWQDFMFACALQPGDSSHLENIRKEAVYNVKRLRNHPSMALWCGNNENLIAWHNWGWKESYTPEQRDFIWETYENIFYKILDQAVKENDPEKSYWPSSPQSFGNELPDKKSGDEHDWGIWFGQLPYEDYSKNTARFVSEYGLQSFPEMATLEYFAKQQDLYVFSPLLNRRQRSKMDWKEKGYNGNHLQLQYIKDYFPDPANFEDFVYLSQVNHQWSMMEAIEGHRKNMPECMGSLYWQINDCWPTMSWASIDYFGNWKAPHYQAKRSFEKFIIAQDISAEGIKLFIVSDSTEAFDAVLNLKWIGTDGKTGTSADIPVRVKANTSGVIAELNYSKDEIPLPSDNNILWAQVIVNDRLLAEKVILTCLPKELDLQKPEITVNSEKTDHGYLINLTTDKPALFIRMSLNEGTGKFSDNYFHLIPGESKTVLIETAEDLTNVQFINIKSLNDLKQSGI